MLAASCFLSWLEAIAVPPAVPPLAATSWPGKTWEESTPAREGLDEKAIAELDAEIRDGKRGYIDSMLIARHGRIVFDARYPRDYAVINAPLMTDESGPYNYYDVAWGGQYALVVPDLDLIGVLTGWSVYDDLEHTYKIFYDEIVLPLARAQHKH